jgi:hypothetical protein
MQILKCSYCNKEFERDYHLYGNTYCSIECYRKSRKGKERPEFRKRFIKKCVVCEKDFEVGGRAGSKKKIFCSVECQRIARYRTGSKCKTITRDEANYIAGFLDGEGSIMINRRCDNKNSFGLRLAFAQSVKGQNILEWIHEKIGVGNINKKGLCGLFLMCNSEAAETLLKQIVNYLILKKPQAELAIKFQENLRIPALKADRNWQKECYDKMKILNMGAKEIYKLTCTAGG